MGSPFPLRPAQLARSVECLPDEDMPRRLRSHRAVSGKSQRGRWLSMCTWVPSSHLAPPASQRVRKEHFTRPPIRPFERWLSTRLVLSLSLPLSPSRVRSLQLESTPTRSLAPSGSIHGHGHGHPSNGAPSDGSIASGRGRPFSLSPSSMRQALNCSRARVRGQSPSVAVLRCHAREKTFCRPSHSWLRRRRMRRREARESTVCSSCS